MVHALKEAQRVLKANGMLIDLRPALSHRRVGIGEGDQVQWLGRTHEEFDEDRAANRAVTLVLKAGLFRRQSLKSFDLDRVIDSVEDFEGWLADFVGEDKSPLDERLIRKLRAAMQAGEKKRITVRGPLRVAIFRKLET